MSSLQERQKWNKVCQNICVGDIVLVKDESKPRGQWPLGCIVLVFKADDQLVKQVAVRIGHNEYERPVQLIFIYRCETKMNRELLLIPPIWVKVLT